MASFKVRRILRGTGGGRFGDGSNYTNLSTAGYQTMAGTARVLEEMWIPATAFGMSACGDAMNAFSEPGSMLATCMVVDISGSLTLPTQKAGSAVWPILQPSANITGSATFAVVGIPRPLGAASSGSIQVRPVWATHDAHATSGSVFVFDAVMAYFSSSAPVRTAASTAACATYNYTASGVIHETNIGNVPSFGANDVAGMLTVFHDQKNAADTGGSGVALLGVKLRYLREALGTQSS